MGLTLPFFRPCGTGFELVTEYPNPLTPFVERRRFYPWLVVGWVCIGNFMGQADASIVQLAMPVLEDAFAARGGELGRGRLGARFRFRPAEIAGRKWSI